MSICINEILTDDNECIYEKKQRHIYGGNIIKINISKICKSHYKLVNVPRLRYMKYSVEINGYISNVYNFILINVFV